jgi:hypothetical protein
MRESFSCLVCAALVIAALVWPYVSHSRNVVNCLGAGYSLSSCLQYGSFN